MNRKGKRVWAERQKKYEISIPLSQLTDLFSGLSKLSGPRYEQILSHRPSLPLLPVCTGKEQDAQLGEVSMLSFIKF